jgi:predicted anti-sigma-YlaC factor YlaD
MTCEVVRAYLSEFMDEGLPAATMEDIRAHFERCDYCREFYEELHTADRFYSAVADREVPEGYRASLRERLEGLVSGAQTER